MGCASVSSEREHDPDNGVACRRNDDARWRILMRARPVFRIVCVAIVTVLFTHAYGAERKAPRRIDISVTKDGFNPRRIQVKRGEEVTLVFTRRTDETCAKDVIVYVDDDHKIARKLPLNEQVELAVSFPKSGEWGFACGLSMHGGAVMVE